MMPFSPRLAVLCAVSLAVLSAQNAQAQFSDLSAPLTSADPKQPIELLADDTWPYSAKVVADTDNATLRFNRVAHDASKGPLHLVIDYASIQGADSGGKASLALGVECEPICAIPASTSGIAINSAYMGKTAVRVGKRTSQTWVAREFRTLNLPSGDLMIDVELVDQQELLPHAIRLRAFYGEADFTPLPGQQTRSGQVWLIALVVGVLLMFAWSRMRR